MSIFRRLFGRKPLNPPYEKVAAFGTGKGTPSNDIAFSIDGSTLIAVK
jgi:hypothetical protein